MGNTVEWENNRMGRESTDLFKKIRDTKGKFHVRMSIIKNRNGKDLTEAEEIKKRRQEYTEGLYQTGLDDLGNHDGGSHTHPQSCPCKNISMSV